MEGGREKASHYYHCFGIPLYLLLLLLLIGLILSGSESTSDSFGTDDAFHNFTLCIKKSDEGTALDRWLNCLHSQKASSSPEMASSSLETASSSSEKPSPTLKTAASSSAFALTTENSDQNLEFSSPISFSTVILLDYHSCIIPEMVIESINVALPSFSKETVESSGVKLSFEQSITNKQLKSRVEELQVGLIDQQSAKSEAVSGALDLQGGLVESKLHEGSIGEANSQSYTTLEICDNVDDKVRLEEDVGSIWFWDANEGAHSSILEQTKKDPSEGFLEGTCSPNSSVLSIGSLALCVVFIQKILKGRHVMRTHKGDGFLHKEITSSRSKNGNPLFWEEKTPAQTSQTDFSTAILGFPLGNAIGVVFAEALLNGECYLSVDQLTELLDTAMSESLCPVLGNKCGEFVNNFKGSFRSAFKTIESARRIQSLKLKEKCLAEEVSECQYLNHCNKQSQVQKEQVDEARSSCINVSTNGKEGVKSPTRKPDNPAYAEIGESSLPDVPLASMPFPMAGIPHAMVVSSSNLNTPALEGWQVGLLNVFKQSVEAQERHNHIKSLALRQKMRRIGLTEEQLEVSLESNELMRESLSLSHSKASFKAKESWERQSDTAYFELCRTCADELVAGMFVMLASLAYGVWRYSYDLVSQLVLSACQPPTKESRKSSWLLHPLYNSLDSISSQVFVLLCRVFVAGRLAFGLAFVILTMSVLLRSNLMSSSQKMPTTVIVVVLGGVCGFLGKSAVGSLGGNGLCWLVLWETLCILHALSTCFTPFVYHVLNGGSQGLSVSSDKPKLLVPVWFRGLVYHSLLVLIIPALAGQLPFAPFGVIVEDLAINIGGIISPSMVYFREWMDYAYRYVQPSNGIVHF